MAHEDIVFNDNKFVENLNIILRKEPSGDLDTFISTKLNVNGIFTDEAPLLKEFLINSVDPVEISVGTFQQGDAVLSQVSTDANPFIDWDRFVALFEANTSVTGAQLLEAFVLDFKLLIGFDTDDWNVLAGDSTLEDADGFPLGVDDLLIEEYFKRH